ncbi:MAG TPA: Xaa-Pro peptidase family protein [Candidatus Limnocylindria bacterium]|nr:Xaa-Pro peptidase family protein [Candidatus Limnocylindria bacterium]
MAGPVTSEAAAARGAVVARRLERARAGLRKHGAGALLVGIGADLEYLTGYAAHPLERLTMLVLAPDGEPLLVTPTLEAMGASLAPAMAIGAVRVLPWDETDNPHRLVAQHLAKCSVPAGSRLLISDRLWAMHVLALRAVLPEMQLGLASEVLRELRMAKAEDEVAALRAAAHAADRVVAQIAGGRLVGRTEADVSREVRERLLAEGHATAEFGIVAAGANSASPHHAASDRVIEAGEPIVLDIGGTLDGYCSDTTRTLWVTGGAPSKGPTSEFLEIFGLVRAAQAAASEAVRPGAGCAELDEVARSIIREGGYGDAFFHRLGHGIGLEGHEDPYLVASSEDVLAPGYAFSIEPGIYLAGRYGVRIEDIVVCGEGGPDVLNVSSRDLWVVNG